MTRSSKYRIVMAFTLLALPMLTGAKGNGCNDPVVIGGDDSGSAGGVPTGGTGGSGSNEGGGGSFPAAGAGGSGSNEGGGDSHSGEFH